MNYPSRLSFQYNYILLSGLVALVSSEFDLHRLSYIPLLLSLPLILFGHLKLYISLAPRSLLLYIFLLSAFFIVIISLVTHSPVSVFSNSAGLLFFIYYFLIPPSHSFVFSLSLHFATLSLFLLFLKFCIAISMNVDILSIVFASFIGNSALPRLYFSYSPFIVLFLLVSLYALLNSSYAHLDYFPNYLRFLFKSRFLSFVFSIIPFLLIIFTGSKALLGSFFIILFFLFALATSSTIIRVLVLSRLSLLRLSLLLLTFLLLIAFVVFLLSNNFLETLIQAEMSSDRFWQYKALISDSTLLGNGFGASLSSGELRDQLGYSYELSFLNLFHKMGLFSIPFFAFLMLLIFSVVRLWTAQRNFRSLSALIVLSLTSCIPISWGNPVLFSSVILLTLSICARAADTISLSTLSQPSPLTRFEK